MKASGTVTNGTFTVEFYMPKDINYTVGDGRILAYADNNVLMFSIIKHKKLETLIQTELMIMKFQKFNCT